MKDFSCFIEKCIVNHAYLVEKMASTGDVETVTAIKFCVVLKKSPTEIFNMIRCLSAKLKCSRA